MDTFRTPFLSLLTGTDKDVLQQIFVQLDAHLASTSERVARLEAMVAESSRGVR
jgi:hypothetical protein